MNAEVVKLESPADRLKSFIGAVRLQAVSPKADYIKNLAELTSAQA